MADSKITALTAISTVDPTADPLVIVDVSDTSMAASGTTKKSTINQLLGSGGTATLASATITGDLTVDTSTLKVDSTNNRVGIKQASPSHPFQIGTNDLILDASSNLGIGVAPNAKLTVYGGGATTSTVNFSGGSAGTDNATIASNYNLHFQVDANNTIGGREFVWRYGGKGYSDGTLFMKLDASGNLSLANGNLVMSTSGKGIDFSATANSGGTMTSELLNDYEEGTFTPTIIGTSTAGTGTYSTQSGTYTKVGRLVSCQIFLNWTAHTGTGDLRISGLPFQVSGASNYFAAAAIGYFSNVSLSAGNIATGYAINATSVITLGQYPTGGGAGAGIAMDTSGEILISVTYIV